MIENAVSGQIEQHPPGDSGMSFCIALPGLSVTADAHLPQIVSDVFSIGCSIGVLTTYSHSPILVVSAGWLCLGSILMVAFILIFSKPPLNNWTFAVTLDSLATAGSLAAFAVRVPITVGAIRKADMRCSALSGTHHSTAS